MDYNTRLWKCKAAVAFKLGERLQIVEIDVEEPKAKEVLVKILHTSVCHTDAFTLSGDDPEGVFQAVLGQGGAGVVVSVGDEVTSVKPGEYVIPLYTAECGECKFCLSSKTNLCSAVRETLGTEDGFYPEQLTEAYFLKNAQENNVAVDYDKEEGYGHSYFFIAIFLEDYFAFHTAYLR